MKFAIADVSFWEEKGFDCTNFRKSVDGTKSLIHYEYAQTLVPDIDTNTNVDVHTKGDTAFDDLLASSEWTDPETTV